MSAHTERMLDHLYKLFMVIMMSVCGFFLMRLVNTVDRTTERVEQLEIKTEVIQHDLSKLVR